MATWFFIQPGIRYGDPRRGLLDGQAWQSSRLMVCRALNRSLEGNTERQKNPHPPTSLAFVAWIAARLGGWNCYYKPPGPKAMRNGWTRLAAMLEGYALAKNEALP